MAINDLQLAKVDEAIQEMFISLRRRTVTLMRAPFQVTTKTGHNDLVTTVDKANERFIRHQISEIDPGARIVGEEESYGHRIDQSLAGHVWIIDPIDGTMNFVRQHNYFAVMVALYIDGQATLGYILDVMNNDLYHCWRHHGAFVNRQKLPEPVPLPLTDCLVDINRYLLLSNTCNLQEVARQAAGLRMYGSAGIELVHVFTGQLGAYMSRLKPWDLAAGRVFAEELNLDVKTIDDRRLNVLSSNTVLVATKRVSRDIQQLIK